MVHFGIMNRSRINNISVLNKAVQIWGQQSFRRIGIILLCMALCTLILMLIPLPGFNNSYSHVLYDNNGELLSATIAEDEQWRFPLSDSVPDKFEKCLLEFEDRYFYLHPGINPVSLIRAIYLNIKNKRIISGGSTLSMQVIRLRGGPTERTIPQKLKEIFLTLHMELKRSKQEILQLYASHAPFGGNTVGLEAASWRYFQRNPFDLTWAESAMLAVLPNAPSLVHPGKNRSLLKQKRDRLLRELLRKNILDTLTYQTAILEELPDSPGNLPQLADHFLQYAKKKQSNHVVHSTLEMDKQQRVNKIVNRYHKQLKHNDIHNIGVVVLDISRMECITYIGNTTSGNEHHQFVDVIQAPRSTGSILKPLLYCSMLNDGELLPHQLVADIPTRYGNYSPQNFSQSHAGAVPADVALARSLNVPAVRMLHQYGMDKFYYQLQQLGFSSFTRGPDHYGLSLILGGGEASLWELTSVYASMGYALQHYNKHDHYPAGSFTRIHYIKTDSLHPNQTDQPNPFRASSIYLTLRAMNEVHRPESETGWEQFASRQAVSWKTGTSFGSKDAWSIGLTTDYCVGVWVGNADGEGRPMLTGNTAAAPIMFEIFSGLHADKSFDKPLDDLKTVETCKTSGYPKNPDCPESTQDFVPLVETKLMPCPFHTVIHISSETGKQVNRKCVEPAAIRSIPWFVLPPAQEWYYRKQNTAYKPLPEWDDRCNKTARISQFQIVYPEPGMRIYIPRERQGKSSGLICEAVHRDPSATLYWYLDEEYLGQTQYVHQMEMKNTSGTHTLSLTDKDGEQQQVSFTVITKTGGIER